MKCKLEGRRKSLRLKGMDGVMKDVRKIEVWNWSVIATDSEGWKMILGEAEM